MYVCVHQMPTLQCHFSGTVHLGFGAESLIDLELTK